MTLSELKIVLSLAAVYGIRMLGLFLILPVFALYAKQLPDYAPITVGLAIGAYGLAQALLQIPLGLLSDRIGRKPVIIGGLLIYAVGGAISALSVNLHGIILGRTIQGCGAFAGPVMALTADLTREEVRLQAMAIIGISIGAAFITSILFAPTLEHWIGVPGIFWLTSGLALSGIVIIKLLIPQPETIATRQYVDVVPARFVLAIYDLELLRTYVGIFTLQLLITSLFLAIPLKLKLLGLPSPQHWKVYVPVLLASVIGIIPLIFLAKRNSYLKSFMLGGIFTLAIAELVIFAFGDNLINLSIALFLYFTAFNLLEAMLPSLVAKLAPSAVKGTAMGIFSSAQFLGAFCGGLLGGVTHQTLGLNAVFLVDSSIAALWWLIIAV
jgi:MFS family permease